MSTGLSQEREYGGRGGSRPMMDGGGSGAPGKRTLTEELGAGDPASQAGPDGAAAGDAGASASATPEDEQIGELSAEQVGADPDDSELGPDVPVRDIEGGKQEIAGAGQELPPQGGADELAGGSALVDEAPAGGGDEGTPSPEVAGAIVSAQDDTREAIAQSETESAAYKAEMTAQRDRFEAEQHATMLEKLKTMSAIEKRQTLQEMGYDPKKVKKLKDAELDGIIEGKIDSENRKTKILGMTPEELAALSPAQKIQYLVDLGIDKGDLDKAGQDKATRLFDDVMRVAHVPGQHQVKIKIKGGLLGKSWVVKVKCDAEGNTDITAEKKGGFLSKLWGWVKAALPIILTVLAPLTAGASLIVLSIYQTAMAIKNGDWLGAVIGVAGAVAGVGAFMAAKGALSASSTFAKIASVASKVKTVAEKAQIAMAAAKAKNAGSLLGALAAGAEAFAKFSTDAAGKFAQTMTRWSERLKKWSAIISGGEKVVQGIKKGDPIAAIGGAFDTAAAVVGPKSSATKTLNRASKITGFVGAGKRALQSNPPDYAAVAEAALGIAGQLHEDRRIDDAKRLVTAANRLKTAWDKRSADPAGLIDAALGLAEAIQLAKYDLEHDEEKDKDGKPLPDADRTAITERYQRAGRIVKAAGNVLEAATTKPRPSYLGALDAATQLIAELTASKQIDAAAVVTSKLDAWTKAVNAKDEKAIMSAGIALGEAIDGLRKVIGEEHAAAKKDAEARLAPGESLPDDAGDALPPGPDANVISSDAALTDPEGGTGDPSTSASGDAGTTPSPSDAAQPPLRFEDEITVTAPSPNDDAHQPLPRIDERSEIGGGGDPGGSADGAGVLPRGIDLNITVTAPAPAPPATRPAPAPPVETAVQQVIDIIKAFAELADDFEHPLAKQFIAQWETLVKTFEALRKNGMTASAAYRDTIAGLKLLKQTGVFADTVAREWKKFQTAFGDPFDAPVTRSVLQSFGRFKRSMGRLARIGGIPQTFLSAADNVIVACGYDKDLSGAEATVAERLEAAANLVREVGSLPGELSWLAAVGRTVAARLGAASAVAAIRTVQTAVNRFGDKVGKVVMRWVAPMLEKLASAEGTQAAVRAAERIAAELAAWGASYEAATTGQLFRQAANLLAGRLGFAFRVATSAPFAIALEVTRLEAQFAAELYRDAYAGISNFMSARLFGKPISQLKNEIRSQPDDTPAQCNALFKYAFYTMLSAADTQVRGGWLPFARQEVPRRVIGSAFESRFPIDPVGALTALEPDDIKVMIAAPAIKDIAGAYLDREYKRVFGQDPE
jgi:hypothetical protein